MFTVTEKAAQYLRQVLDSREEATSQLLRIVSRSGSYELTLDDPQESDEVLQYEGRSYLLVAPEVVESLSNATIDVHEIAEGAPPRLTLSTG